MATAIASVVFLAFAALCQIVQVPTWVRIFSYVGLLVAILGIWDAAATYVALDGDLLIIACGLRRRKKVVREDIQKVLWERESGVNLQLRDETWIKLPMTGQSSQELANSLRAWRKGKAAPLTSLSTESCGTESQ